MAMQYKNSFVKGINLDLDETRIPPDTATFIKNITFNVNTNPNTSGDTGSNQYVGTPVEGNKPLTISGMPAGNNFCCGFYSSEQTNEGYFCIFNSNGNHTIWVIEGATGTVTKVHENTLLPFSSNPEHFFSEGRITLERKSIIDPVTKQESNFKLLVLTNNNGNQCMIDVDASIATDSYTTPYFTSSAAFYDPLELIHLGSPLPIKCIGLNNPNAYTPVTNTTIIDTAVITSQGTGWHEGDTFDIIAPGGGTNGTGKVISVNTGTGVISFQLTSGGLGFSISTGVATSATGGATGTGLVLSILSLVTPDTSKQNLIVNEGWQFRVRTWDVFGRPSEWGIISSVYTSLIGGGCIATSNGLPRCVNLCFDAGNPQIKFITIAYRRGVGNDPSGQTETGWYEHETISKYDDSLDVEWYERPINPQFTTANSGMTFDAGTNQITYAFCADKGSRPVDPIEAARTEPGIPRISGSVFSIEKVVGLANNVYDFQPIAQPVVDAIQFSASLPQSGDPSEVPCPAAPLRTIVVYAHIYNAFTDDRGSDGQPLIRHTYGVVTFGNGGNAIAPNTPTCYVNNFAVGQVFADQDNPGFIAYLAGTPFAVVGKWGDYDSNTDTFTQDSGFTGAGGNLKVIQFTFVDIPAGKYVVRLASHHAKLSDANLQQTSTQVFGACLIGSWFFPNAIFNNCCANPVKELQVDCSAGNVNGGTNSGVMLVILDLNNGVKSNGIDGYLYEQLGGGPIEMAPCYIHGSTLGQPGDAYGSFYTDHNGYYFMASGSSYAGIDIYVDFCDGNGAQAVFSQTAGCGGSTGKMAHGDGSGSRSPDYFGNFGNWQNRVYAARAGGYVTTFPDAARRRVRQQITVCSQDTVGVPGVPLVMTKTATALTDSSGLAEIIAHNRIKYDSVDYGGRPLPYGADLLPDYGSVPGNQDLIIFSQKGGCEWDACSSCDTFMADALVTYLDCGAPASGCTSTQPDRTLCLPKLSVQPNGVGIYGVQSGGKYPVAVWFHDVLGRHTSPQTRAGDNGYVFVPNLNDTAPPPYPSMALSSLQVTIPAGLTVDPVFTHMTFLVGSNCLFSDFFSWAADWVQYVDNTGATNTTNPTAIRIYFQSLNEYNKQYNFGTNVAWDFITSQDQVRADTALPSDVVQFIMNGDGTWLAPQKGAPVTYDKFGSFFTIDYIPELAGLQNGCLFRVIRPKQNSTGVDLPYYEQCLTLSIEDGVLPNGTWQIPYQDSYLLSRAVPVPRLKGELGPISPGGIATGIQYTSTDSTTVPNSEYSTNNVSNNNNVVIFQTIDDTITFPFFFESPSPSDLWGSRLSSKGRVGIPNPYEQQYRVGTEIALSNPLADRGIVNGIGTYLEANREIFDRNTFGDITVVLVEMGVAMVICNTDFFITRYNQTQIQITENGQIMGQNTGGTIFTAPQTKIGSNFGVIPLNINSIQRYNGQVVFLDNKGHLIFSDFSTAKPMEKDGYLGYLLNKISNINLANQTAETNGYTYWSAGIDPKTMEYVLTSFHMPKTLTGAFYINTDRQPELRSNETFIFDLNTGILKSFAAFTPEYYGRIPGFYLQRQFLSFKSGVPYIHHDNLAITTGAVPYSNYYGTQCDVRITHVINGIDGKLLPDTVKRYLAAAIYCRQNIPGPVGTMPSALFHADYILSEKGQESRLKVPRWSIRDGYQCAEYLCAINTPPDPNIPVETGANAILEGDPLQGRWTIVSITNNPDWTGTYFEVSSKVDYINIVQKSAD